MQRTECQRQGCGVRFKWNFRRAYIKDFNGQRVRVQDCPACCTPHRFPPNLVPVR